MSPSKQVGPKPGTTADATAAGYGTLNVGPTVGVLGYIGVPVGVATPLTKGYDPAIEHRCWVWIPHQREAPGSVASVIAGAV